MYVDILILNWRDITHPQAGGAERYIHEIGKRLVRMGHRVTLFCGSYSGAASTEIIDGIKIVRKGGRYTVYPWALWYLLRHWDKFDVIIDSENGIPFFSPLVVNGKRVICIMHHVHLDVFDREMSFPLNLIGKFLEGKLMPKTYTESLFVSVSPSTKAEMINRLNIRGEYFPIVYNGVTIPKESITPQSKKPLMIYFGRVKRYKRVEHIIKAFEQVTQRIKNVELVIAGKADVSYLEELLKLAGELSLKISIFQDVPESKKWQLLSRSWVYVITSMREGWGISVIEANACGIPAVGYNVPGLQSSIQHGYNGFLVDEGNITQLAESIIHIIKNPKIRRKLQHNARKWAQRFNWDESARRFDFIIRRILEGSG